MAYVSAHHTSNWAYERGGSDFNARLGTLLANGADLRAAAAASCGSTQQRARPGSSRPNTQNDAAKEPLAPAAWIGPRPGFAWVDEHGTLLAMGPPAACLTAPVVAPAGGCSSSSAAAAGGACSSRGTMYAGMTASQRSMVLWERVSPGMLPNTTRTPAATTAEAYAWPGALAEPVDLTHHLRRTDFAEYTECKLRHMHHIQAAAKK